MTENLNRRDILRAAVAGAAVYSSTGHTQSTWPSKPVTMVVPFPAGGGTDAFARPLAAQFTRLTGQSMVIVNHGGAGGTLGAAIAARATPDGYTLLAGAVHHAIAPSMFPRLDYDIQTDFIPLILTASVPQVLVVNPQNMPVAGFREFLAQVRANPGKYDYASAGSGTSHHLAGELFKQQTNTFITHIPYRGAGPALRDLIGGQVDMMFDGLGSSAAHIRGGRIRALMVAGPRRNPAIPDVPSAGELGLPDYNVTTWYGVWTPRGTPAEVQARAIEEIRKAINTDEVRAIWANQGAEFANVSGPQFGAFVTSEIAKWAQVVKASGARLD